MDSPVLSAGTVATGSYLARAKTAAQSFLGAHPTSRFYILMADGSSPRERVDGVVWLTPGDLGESALFEMRLRYTPLELCCALKVFLAREVLTRSGGLFIYLDSDVLVYRPLDEIRELATTSPIILFPHLTGHLPGPTSFQRERDLLECGVFNAGCFAVRASPTTTSFLSWWASRVRRDCRYSPNEGMFYDQKWLDLVPAMFPSVAVMRDAAYNVAYWNLFERRLARVGDVWMVNDIPLAMFHFSGLDVDTGAFQVFKGMDLMVGEWDPVTHLITAYIRQIRRHEASESPAYPYQYPLFADGTRADHVFHVLWASLSDSERAQFGDPYEVGGRGSFLGWATSARQDVGLSPYLETMYRLRPDLQMAFPDVYGQNRLQFLNWALTSGASEGGYDPVALRIPELVSWSPGDQPQR